MVCFYGIAVAANVKKRCKKNPRITAVIAVLVYLITYMIRFRGPDNFVFQHIARLGMSYSELLIGVYFCKYKFMDLVIVVRRFVPTLLIAPISGMVFVVAYLLAV